MSWRSGRLLAPSIGVLISLTSCKASPRCACLQRLLHKYIKFILESYNVFMLNTRHDCQPLVACCARRFRPYSESQKFGTQIW